MTIEEFYPIFLNQKQRFTTDSRQLADGDIFFALKGENFNGNLYAIQALKSGASYVVVDEAVEPDSKQIIRVPDVLEFMQALATHHRRQFDIPIIAIAGSNGKTTTKELLISVLTQQFKVHATAGNFNNHIGVPITLLSMPLDTEIALIEIGTNSFGEIEFLCQMLKPNFGLITNIGKEHLEGFGDIEGVALEESELYKYLFDSNGFAFVNEDDTYLGRMSHRLKNKLNFSIHDTHAPVFLDIKRVAPGLKMTFNNQEIASGLSGLHNAQNIAASVAVGHHFGLSPIQLSQGIEAYRPSNNRSEIKHLGNNHFLMDAYNANPSSMEAAIDTFSHLDSPNKVLLLGDMFELGGNTLEEHSLIARKAHKLKNCTVFLAGKTFKEATQNYGMRCFDTTEELVKHLKSESYKDTWFLVKGSRGMKMEDILNAFTNETS